MSSASLDDARFVERQLQQLLREARQRVREQAEKEKSVLELLNVKGYETAPLEDKAAYIKERVKRDKTLNECADRFLTFIADKEDAFRAGERQLRFPLGMLRHIRSENGWDQEGPARSEDLSFVKNYEHNRLACDAPSFVALLNRSKEVFHEIAAYGEMSRFTIDPSLPTLQSKIESLITQLSEINAEIADLQRDTQQKAEAATVREAENRRMAGECEDWQNQLASDIAASELRAVKDRGGWEQSVLAEVQHLKVEVSTLQQQLAMLETARARVVDFKRQNDKAIEQHNEEITMLDGATKELAQAAAQGESQGTTLENDFRKAEKERQALLEMLQTAEETLDERLSALTIAKDRLKVMQEKSSRAQDEQAVLVKNLAVCRDVAQRSAGAERMLEEELALATKELEKTSAIKQSLSVDIDYLDQLRRGSIRSFHGALGSVPGSTSTHSDNSDLLVRAREARRRFQTSSTGNHVFKEG